MSIQRSNGWLWHSLFCYFLPQCMHHFFDYHPHLASMITTSTWMIQRVFVIYLTFQTWILHLHYLEPWHPHNDAFYQYHCVACQACYPIWFETFTWLCLWLQWKSSGLDTLWICDINTHPIVGIWELHRSCQQWLRNCVWSVVYKWLKRSGMD